MGEDNKERKSQAERVEHVPQQKGRTQGQHFRSAVFTSRWTSGCVTNSVAVGLRLRVRWSVARDDFVSGQSGHVT